MTGPTYTPRNRPGGAPPSASITPLAVSGGPLAFTFGSWFTWTAIGLAFPLLGIVLVVVAPLLPRGAWDAPSVFAAVHIATLGWGTMVIVGAAAQMAPALLGARIRGERTVPWQYGLFTLSVCLMTIGFLRSNFMLVAVGGSGVNLASWWFVGLVIATVTAAGRRPVPVPPHIPVALACLVLVLLWGTMLALNLRWGFWPGLLIAHRGLVVHLALGLGGWLGLMVVGTFYRVVPLMHGARVVHAGRGWIILLLAGSATLGTLAGVAWGIGWLFRLAAICSAAAFLCFSWEIVHVLHYRRNRAPDLNVSHWYAVAAYSVMLAGAGLAWGTAWRPPGDSDRLGACVVVLFLLGWVTQAIIGQLYKVTPFLMWYHRATMPNVSGISRRPDLYNPFPGRVVWWLSNAGVVGVAWGLWAGAVVLTQAGAVLFAAAAWVLAYMLAYRWIPPVASNALAFQWRWRIS